ncbi:MAG: hypothetical protein MI920_18550 [Kiloniellales bacterium]|nr:hypothetical protein [Kiloniellales bacterium]
MFHAVYDLSVSPTSYDFLTFLALADLARARAGCPAMQVVFVPDNGSGFWDREPTSEDGKAWRLHNLLIPALQLYPAVAGYAVAASRAEARRLVSRLPAPLFPEGYAVDRPVEDAYQWAHTVAAFLNGQPPASWRPPAAALGYVRDWLSAHAEGRRVISITLRDSPYRSERRSNIEAWGAFARLVREEGFYPVIVPDTDRALSPPPEAIEGLPVLPEASFNIALRGALYELSDLSLLHSNGPMMMLWLNERIRSITFNLFDEPTGVTANSLRSMGLEIGHQLPFGADRHWLVWEKDERDVIERHFRAFLEGRPGPDHRPWSQDPIEAADRLRESACYGAARRIYEGLHARGEESAAALYGISHTILETPGRSRWQRYVAASAYLLRGRAAERRTPCRSGAALLEKAACFQRWKLAGAAAAVRQGIAVAPASPRAQYLAGHLALAEGRPERALAHLEAAADGDRTNCLYRLALAEALRRVDRQEDAEEQRAFALRLDPNVASLGETALGRLGFTIGRSGRLASP